MWNLESSTGELNTVSYYFGGMNMMNIYTRPGKLPKLDVAFFGEDGKVRALWSNRGTNAGFTERIQYGVDKPRREIWFNEGWHFLEYHTNTNDGKIQAGIMLDGAWHHVVFTNDNTEIDTPLETP
jgi:hypothetical protein